MGEAMEASESQVPSWASSFSIVQLVGLGIG